MKTLIAVIAVFGVWASAGALLIESTPMGGAWTQGSTWTGNVVPGAGDDVVIHGLVFVNTNVACANLTVAGTGSLMNTGGQNWFLTINAAFINFGSCENNPGGGNLDINLYGAYEHYGVLTNRTVYLRNPGLMTWYQHPDAWPISSQQWVSSGTTGNYKLMSYLRFDGTLVDLNSHSLQMYDGANSFGLSLWGGNFYRASLDTNGFSDLELGNGAYLYNVQAEDIKLIGAAKIYFGVSFQNLNNYADLTTHTGGTYNLTVNNDLFNHGYIHNSSGNIYVQLYGDLYDYSNLASYFTYFNSTDTQYVYQDPGAAPINCSIFGKQTSVNGGGIVMLSDLRFLNTIVDMNYRDLICHSGGLPHNLELNGGKLYRITLVTSGFSSLTMSGNAYLDYVTAGDFELFGTVIATAGVSFDDVVNHGALQPYIASPYLVINGNLTNLGQVTNTASGNLYLFLRGNLYNRGSLTCYHLGLDSTQDQLVLINPAYPIGCQRFTLYSQAGPAQFYLNGFLQQQNSTYFDIQFPNNPGVWQIVAGATVRTVTIEFGPDALAAPQIISFAPVGTGLHLLFTEVPGAVRYLIYAGDTPASFPDFSYAYDPIPGDGSVIYQILPGQGRRFYYVKATD